MIILYSKALPVVIPEGNESMKEPTVCKGLHHDDVEVIQLH